MAQEKTGVTAKARITLKKYHGEITEGAEPYEVITKEVDLKLLEDFKQCH